jgi:hypothetical protein
VVAADHDHAGPRAPQSAQRVAEQRQGLDRGQRPVVDVAAVQDDIHALGPDHLDEVVQECLLRRS